jgi:hypothetical protein
MTFAGGDGPLDRQEELNNKLMNSLLLGHAAPDSRQDIESGKQAGCAVRM